MQVARAIGVAEGVEHKHRHVDIKLFAIHSDAKVAAVHGACGGAQARAAGVFKLFAGLQQGLVADHAQAFDFFVQAVCAVDVPGARNELGRYLARVGDLDGVGEHIQIILRGGLLG